MLARLEGLVLEQNLDGSCIVDVQGVGYEVFIPPSAAAKLPTPPNTAVLFLHTHVREDAITLYGFGSALDRTAFRTLLSVSGVGPKVALSILSAMTAEELALAIGAGDKKRFRGISGVGTKIMERLFLELKDKLFALQTSAKINGAKRTIPPSDSLHVVQSALLQMGYRTAETDVALNSLALQSQGKPVEVLLREALSLLS